jgi:hypothetical protein
LTVGFNFKLRKSKNLVLMNYFIKNNLKTGFVRAGLGAALSGIFQNQPPAADRQILPQAS